MAEIIIQDHQFDPHEINISAGETVTFRNESTESHTVTADDASFDSGELAPGDYYDYLFDSPGECNFHCEDHPTMTGRIFVE